MEEDLEGAGVNAFLVDNDKVLVGGITNLALEGNNGRNTIINKLAEKGSRHQYE